MIGVPKSLFDDMARWVPVGPRGYPQSEHATLEWLGEEKGNGLHGVHEGQMEGSSLVLSPSKGHASLCNAWGR